MRIDDGCRHRGTARTMHTDIGSKVADEFSKRVVGQKNLAVARCAMKVRQDYRVTIDAGHRAARTEKLLRDMATKESVDSGDENFHARRG